MKISLVSMGLVLESEARHVEWLMTRNTNRHSNVRVRTTQRSIAAMASAWLRRNVRQVCDGGPRCRIMYLETVDSAISNPSFSSSPWMRGAPHKGFSLLIRWMSSRSSRRTGAALAECRISSANRREILLDATAVSCQAERSGPT